MKPLFNKLGPKPGNKDKGHDPEREAAQAIEKARREAASRVGRPAPSSGLSPRPSSPPPEPQPPTFVEREPAQPPAPPPGSKFAERPPSQAPPASRPSGPPGGGFAPPGAGGPSATPDEERRAITDMALEDLRARRAPSEEAAPPRLPSEELERRRPPAPGESLPGVPPPHIPSEDLRDQALQEILDRKERLDREYRERMEREAREQGLPVPGGESPRPKGKLHGLAKKKLGAAARPRPDEPAAQVAAEEAPSPAAPPKRTLKKLRGKAPSSPRPPSAPAQPAADEPPAPPEAPPETTTTTTGETADEALAAIKGVGPVIRGALLDRFQSVEAIREAEADELTEVDGVGPALAKRIKTSL